MDQPVSQPGPAAPQLQQPSSAVEPPQPAQDDDILFQVVRPLAHQISKAATQGAMSNIELPSLHELTRL